MFGRGRTLAHNLFVLSASSCGALVALLKSRVLAVKSRSYLGQDRDNAGVRKELRGPEEDSSLPMLAEWREEGRTSLTLRQLVVFPGQSLKSLRECWPCICTRGQHEDNFH